MTEPKSIRKITAGLVMSLDGVVEAPSSWGGNHFFNDEMNAMVAANLRQVDAVLLGTRTYLDFVDIWPKIGNASPMSTLLNSATKYVVSSTLTALPWQPATFIRGDLTAEITNLKRQPGKNIQIPGSPRLVGLLLAKGLLDELTLLICPVVVGSGMRLYDGLTVPVNLELINSKTLRNGALSATYRAVQAKGRDQQQQAKIKSATAR